MSNETRPIRRRRTAAEIDAIRNALHAVLEEDHPMTVRQVFYRLVSAGVIEKTEAEYKQTVCRLLVEMRRRKEIPYGWIADSTRWQRKPRTWSSMEHALQHTAECYRRAVWDWQGVYVEVWLEKDALAGVLFEVTSEWDVPLMVTRGYPSLSYLHDAAEAIQAHDRPAYLYYFGDYDPSGIDIPRAVEAGLREMAPGAEIHFERVAVNQAQIMEHALQTRPTKKTDSRSRNFEGESVEVDALPPRVLREMASRCIVGHVDEYAYERLLKTEELERADLLKIAAALRGGG